ncbi:MAG TPA: heparinase II/III family protein [Gemmatimonadaceae bacterium]|nr:heparinase II/III family protein [Gemmatimonadaceae bacterium]
MTLLVTPTEVAERKRIANGSLAPLADSLTADLERLLVVTPEIPRDKARLSRAGGRCPTDGTALEYDPWSPDAHLCPRCGTVFSDEAHYRYWLMWHQLWIAERSVHAAVLYALRGDGRHRQLALSLLRDYSERYLEYPNRDNVLGPSRVFFSTYLESIWLLQLCVAIDVLELAGVRDGVLGAARDRIVAPAAALIASYDEGTSNRQAWNVAALLASALLLGDNARAERIATSGHGLRFLLDTALLPDGSWYEGENYHVFAHRGLWYGVSMAERAGIALGETLRTRFDRGFALPFRTALPDLTMLARRDSQYAISLRQWRFAELCELGLARRGDDSELRAALGRLYEPGPPRRDSGRSRSSAEAERHSPESALTRADLGWRSLLHARESLPPLEGAAPRSVLLRSQGLAVFRRDEGRMFAALDYGETGGGHGHPDRLNVIVCDGANRWLDDPGTGSYVDRSLHWYRSTLAHSAPLVDRASQPRLAGILLAFDERGAAGWVAARALLADDVVAERRLVTMTDYTIDELSWNTAGRHVIALPIHLDLAVEGLAWRSEPLGGAGGLEDGFDFVTEAEVATPGEWPLRAVATEPGTGAMADVWLSAPSGTRLWRVTAPAPPSHPTDTRRFAMLECSAPRGAFTTVSAPRRTIASLAIRDASLVVEHADGSVHEHAGGDASWRIALRAANATSSIDLGGAIARPTVVERDEGDAEAAEVTTVAAGPETTLAVDPHRALSFSLGERDYRRSEESWTEAGSPTAEVVVATERGELRVTVTARTGPSVVISDEAVNEMDNEQPDVNATGLQLSLRDARGILHRWLVRPGADQAPRVRALTRETIPRRIETTVDAEHWVARIAIPLGALGDASPYFIALGVTINEIAPGRERRRGQLVLGGAEGEWVYLRGDRDDPSKLIPIVIDR